MTKLRTLVSLSLLCLPHIASAFELDDLADASSEQLEQITEDAMAAWQFPTQGPTALLDEPRFQLAGTAHAALINNNDAWSDVLSEGSDSTAVVGATGRIKLLPRLQLGAMAAVISESEGQVYGVEARYLLLDDAARTPAVELRGSYAWLHGTNDIQYSTQTVEALLAHRFWGRFTPYLGAGYAFGQMDVNSAAEAQSLGQTRLLGGFQLQLNTMAVVAEALLQDEVQAGSLSLRFGWF